MTEAQFTICLRNMSKATPEELFCLTMFITGKKPDGWAERLEEIGRQQEQKGIEIKVHHYEFRFPPDLPFDVSNC